MPDQLLLDVCSVLIRYVVQQVADTPCHMYLFCVLEVRTVNAGGRNTHWVYDADVGRVSGSEKCSHPTQAVTSFRTLLVVAAGVVERDCFVFLFIVVHFILYITYMIDKGSAFIVERYNLKKKKRERMGEGNTLHL